MQRDLYWVAASVNSMVLIFFFVARYKIFRRTNAYGGSYLSRAGTISGVVSLISIAFGYSETAAWQSLAALVLALISVMFFGLSIRAFNGRNPGIALAGFQPSSLVISGPYKIVRHPLYLSYIINWLAMAVLCPTFLVICAFLLMVVLYRRVALEEEREMGRSLLAESYRDYSSRVPMLIPGASWISRLRGRLG